MDFVLGPVVIQPERRASDTRLTSLSVISGGEKGTFFIRNNFNLLFFVSHREMRSSF